MEFHLSLFKSSWFTIQKYKVNKIFKKNIILIIYYKNNLFKI